MDPRGVLVVEDVPLGIARVAPRRPDALEHVANRPIAHHVLDILQGVGIADVVVVTSSASADEVVRSLGERPESSGLRIQHVMEPGSVNVAGALRAAAPFVGGAACVVHTASGLLGEALAPFLQPLSDGAPDVTVFVHQGTAGTGHLNPGTQEMLHLVELDTERAALGLAGAWVLGPGAIELVADAAWQTGSEVDLTPVATRVERNEGRFRVVPADSWCSYAGDSLDLLELNRIALDGLQSELRRPHSNGNRFEGRVWIHEHASVTSSVVVGPTVIGPGARICDAYIGPYTSIGAGAKIEGAEIERSIISSGASIMHIGGRIVSSVVGRDARVFRDFSLPRALRLRVGDGTEVALC